ncbi:hypothetical protein BDV98DRAFT_593718, partial [Pterulicium gracile]
MSDHTSSSDSSDLSSLPSSDHASAGPHTVGNTPFRQKTFSVPLVHSQHSSHHLPQEDQFSWTADGDRELMDAALAKEMKGHHVKQFPDLDRLLFPDALFSNKNHPMIRVIKHFRKTNVLSVNAATDKVTWTDAPDFHAHSTEGVQERELCKFLNRVTTYAAAYLERANSQRPPQPKHNERRWTDGLNPPLAHEGWKYAISGLSANSREDRMDSNVEQLFDIAFNIFSFQDNRRYITTLGFAGDQFQVYYFDRS